MPPQGMSAEPCGFYEHDWVCTRRKGRPYRINIGDGSEYFAQKFVWTCRVCGDQKTQAEVAQIRLPRNGRPVGSIGGKP